MIFSYVIKGEGARLVAISTQPRLPVLKALASLHFFLRKEVNKKKKRQKRACCAARVIHLGIFGHLDEVNGSGESVFTSLTLSGDATLAAWASNDRGR